MNHDHAKLRESRKEQHGMHGTPEYTVWQNMKARCYNKNSTYYENYGGRGIKVNEKWRRSFKAFFEHVGMRPSTTHSLDRIDNDGNYEPGNVRWATKTEQNANKRPRPGKSGHKNVYLLKRSNLKRYQKGEREYYQVVFSRYNVNECVGNYATLEEAIAGRDGWLKGESYAKSLFQIALLEAEKAAMLRQRHYDQKLIAEAERRGYEKARKLYSHSKGGETYGAGV